MAPRSKTKTFYTRRRKNKRPLAVKIPGSFLKMVILITPVILMSLGFILIHDLVIQSGYFRAKKLIVTGTRRLSAEQILQQADIRFGSNILAVNLSVSRKKLLAHPWIAEAAVMREIPDKIRIAITEHVPLAVVDLGRKFLISDKRIIFKEKERSDPANLPIVRGLRYADIRVAGEKARFKTSKNSISEGTRRSAHAGYRQKEKNPMDAVMEILHLGLSEDSILPNERIKQIWVDKDMGLTLYPVGTVRKIRLGYHEYSRKYTVLQEVFKFIKHQQIHRVTDFDVIDLNNLNRVVLVPVKTQKPAKNPKEV